MCQNHRQCGFYKYVVEGDSSSKLLKVAENNLESFWTLFFCPFGRCTLLALIHLGFTNSLYNSTRWGKGRVGEGSDSPLFYCLHNTPTKYTLCVKSLTDPRSLCTSIFNFLDVLRTITFIGLAVLMLNITKYVQTKSYICISYTSYIIVYYRYIKCEIFKRRL